MRILLATDAWRPQVNGVVRTWETSIARLRELGHHVEVIEPNLFSGMPCPFYPEIRLCLPLQSKIVRRINDFQPDVIHIATEGPIGLAVRVYCRRRNLFFTTSYHTRFPEYLQQMLLLPTRIGYAFMRRFHRRSSAIMVATPSLEAELRQRGFTPPIKRWSRGVDLQLFQPRVKTPSEWPRPILLYVGRVSKEKGIEDFLRLNTPGTKVIVGDGPIRERFAFAVAEKFRLRILRFEALASGVPVAAYPVVGPIDIITQPKIGALDDDLGKAVERALRDSDAAECVRIARQYTWENCTQQLLANFVEVRMGEHSSFSLSPASGEREKEGFRVRNTLNFLRTSVIIPS